MNYYPVIIITLNRYKHFRRCVETLAMNTHAEQTELVIGLDYPPNEKYVEGYNEIRAFIPQISGFRKVTVFERSKNLGPDQNYADLLNYCYDNYDAVMFTEDDNEFSPCFLDFMNKALDKYKEDLRVSSVQGYNDARYYNITDKNIYFVPSGGAWGLGQWRNKQYMLNTDANCSKEILHSLGASLKIFLTFPAILDMLVAMAEKGVVWGDVSCCCKNVLNGWYQLKPRISMVRNMGNDGSGVHCDIDSHYASQEIESATVFELDDVEPGSATNLKTSQFYSLLPENRIKAWIAVCKIIIRYVIFRVKN